MDLSDARQRLDGAIRYELRDHVFGDREVTWVKDKCVLAEGYFGSGRPHVHIQGGRECVFYGEDARSLLDCGTLEVERNDETGPDEFVEGKMSPGVTKAYVLKEITTPPKEA